MSPSNVQVDFAKIRKKLIHRALQNLARGAGVRENFESQLERFYDLLEQALVTGDPAWLDAVIFDWVNANTQTDIAEGQKNATNLLNILFTLTNEVARESLNKGEALDMITAVQPIFTYALDKAARLEMENRVAYFANEITSVQQKLEKLDRSKSNFISVAAHELKTPLTLIEGYTSMMRDASASPEANNMDPLLRGVRTGIQRLRQIVDDMIDVSLIDNNMLSLNSQPLWLSHLLDLLQKNLGETMQERRLNLETRKFPGSQEWLYADPERLYQAFLNLLTNAIKYTPDGGSIIVDGRTLPGFVEVTIADTGIGISPEDQAVIFEKFGQLGRADLHSSSKVKFKGGGPGLGLSITRGIIEAHGGTIWVESEGCDEEKCPGSTFHVLLPFRTESSDPRLSKLFGDLNKPEGINVEKETRTDPPPA
ncbi:MAG: sensor histidine kinase [Anaerolineaceae bacterium]|nr:MAG: sensor histidine kinase [Anaerolineaceae bacterium]